MILKQRGQALLEFALVLSFIILPFTFVLVDGALLLFHLANITNVVREGARAGSIWQCKAPECAVDYALPIWDQYPPLDAARLQFIKDDMLQHYSPIASFADCRTDVTYMPEVPFKYATTCTRYSDEDNTVCILNRDENGDPIPVWNIYRGTYSLSVKLACPHHLLFGLSASDTITLTGESTMSIEPGGIAP